MTREPRIPAAERDAWRSRIAAATSDLERLRLLQQLDARLAGAAERRPHGPHSQPPLPPAGHSAPPMIPACGERVL